MISVAITLAWPGAAGAAAEKPLFAPVPAWVRPVAPPAAAAPADEAPVRFLLTDQQIAFEAARQTVYSATVMQIQTPQGLAAGNISLPWRPDTDILTVHAVRIHRGTTVIDVLASGQTFTVVRREANLENAMLDGVLTANIQPEGLQVGDRLEVALSVASSDPTLNGHAEQLAANWNGVPMARAHLRMIWPTTVPMRLRATGGLVLPKPVHAGGRTEIDIRQDDVKPVVLPKGAPRRFQLGRFVEATDYADWSALSALMAPLYRTAATLPADGPLVAEVARIRALSPDPRIRTEAALALVQDRIRYVALAMGTGGLVPATAAETWGRRYGDCKGKTALLLALLAALDVPAEPVAVSTVFGDGMDRRLPMIALFDHVLVRATVAGRPYWLDGTRTGDIALDRLEVPHYGWGLPLVATGGALVPMVPALPARPYDDVTIRIDATAGIGVPAPVRIEQVFRGDLAQSARLGLASLAGDARDRALRDYWKSRYDFIDATTMTASYDPKTGEQRMVLDGKARMDWGSYGYETDGMGIGYKADFSRDPGPDAQAPFAVPYPLYNRAKETILLPPGFETLKAGGKGDVDRTLAGIAYRRTSSLVDNMFTIEKTERAVTPEFAFADAAAAQIELRKLGEDTIYVRKPAGYRATSTEVDATLAKPATTAQDYFDRGLLMMRQEQYRVAIEEFDEALKRDPKFVWALANRGMARLMLADPEATTDIDAAALLDPRNPVMLRGRGRLAFNKGAFEDAVAAYTGSLEVEAANSYALNNRALTYYLLGNDERALEDTAEAKRVDPRWSFAYGIRARILHRQGKHDLAAAEVRDMVAAGPREIATHLEAAHLYRQMERRADAMHQFELALAIKPAVQIYVERYGARDRADLAGRQADLDAIVKLAPKSGFVLVERGRMLEQAGRRPAAIALYTTAIATRPEKPRWLMLRGILFATEGKTSAADADFARAHSLGKDPADSNGYCWGKARANVALVSALADCETALKSAPDNPAYLDSKGLVLLRLARLADARLAYDRALAKSPMLASALYGRALVRTRQGDRPGADADAARALRADPDVAQHYAEIGLTL